MNRTRMGFFGICLVLAWATGACLHVTQEAPPAVPVYDAATFFETTTYRGASFSADEGSLLISSDATGVFNAYRIPLAGGDPEPLTQSQSDSIQAVSWFPTDDRFLYTADQGGNELNHLFVRESDGSVKDLTPGENLKAYFTGWRRDEQAFFVSSNERDPRYFDVYEYQAKDYRRTRLFENREGWVVSLVSPDGRWIVLVRVHDNSNNDLYLWDRKSPRSAPRHVTPHEGQATYSALSFAPDGSRLFYGTDAHGEFEQAWSYDLGSGQHEPVLRADWDVSRLEFSRNGRYRVTTINQDGATAATITDMQRGEPVSLEGLPRGNYWGFEFSPSENWAAFYIDQDRSPDDLFVLNLETGESRRLTQALNPAVEGSALVEAEVVRYPSFDEMEIPAFLYRPHQASALQRVPALVWVHGGPGGQNRSGYQATIQHLVNHGYAVLAVNNRGSSGYGKTFFHLDDRKHGDVDLKDCIWGRRYLEKLDWVDGTRIGIIGGSYGGYMVAAALAFEPDAFEVGIDIFGVTNWLRTLQSIPPWWEAGRRGLYAELGDPSQEEERLRAISPLFHADRIRKPLLVVQGANDPRVLQVESDEIVDAVRRNGVPVEYVVFPDEGHGFRKRANRITASERYVQFLERYLRGGQSE